MKNLKQEFVIDYKRIEKVIKNNMKLRDYSKNSFIVSLKAQLDSGRLLTNSQKAALKKMDVLGNLRKLKK